MGRDIYGDGAFFVICNCTIDIERYRKNVNIKNFGLSITIHSNYCKENFLAATFNLETGTYGPQHKRRNVLDT